ncbi:hypothetical protein [Mesorhizobium sp. B3-2-1]|uniref:hypothetical protein n=1 Tax=Mesorhizobium sp. B3-2-1 TaxID=2589891 RepID=UPI001AEEE428|nr:hypothetical protein [Mesorhizobium sp. B3-2-1]
MAIAVRVIEQLARKLGGRGVALQQIPEALKLVHDDQVGLQRVYAGMRDLPRSLPTSALRRWASS